MFHNHRNDIRAFQSQDPEPWDSLHINVTL